MPPLLAVVVSNNAPAEVSVVVVVSALLLDTDRLAKRAPLDPTLSAPAPLLTTLAAPVVLTVRMGVDVLMLVIPPEPEVSAIDVEPVRVPAVSVIAPELVAPIVT